MRTTLLTRKDAGVVRSDAVVIHMMKPLMTKKMSTPAAPNDAQPELKYSRAMPSAWKNTTIRAAAARKYWIDRIFGMIEDNVDSKGWR